MDEAGRTYIIELLVSLELQVRQATKPDEILIKRLKEAKYGLGAFFEHCPGNSIQHDIMTWINQLIGTMEKKTTTSSVRKCSRIVMERDVAKIVEPI